MAKTRHELRAEYMGPDTSMPGCMLWCGRDYPFEEADRMVKEVRQRIHQSTAAGYCMIQVDAER